MEKKIKLTPEEVILKRIVVDDLKFKIRAKEQENLIREQDLKDDMPNKIQRLKIRQNNAEIEKMKHEVKIHEKMLREGEQIVEELTKEDFEKFEEEKQKELNNLQEE